MTVKSSSLVLLLALVASLSIAQDCNNPLLATYNLPALPTPISGSGLPFCQNLQNGQTCCSLATVQSFQGLINTLTNDLQSAAGARDAYLVQLRNSYATQYQSLNGVLQSYAGDIPAIGAQNTLLGNNLTADAATLNDVSNRLNTINNDFTGAIRDYQNARQECFVDLLRVQASAWCLACDPNYAANGVRSNGAITFSNDLLEDISSDCYDYLEAAERFNPLYRAEQSYQRLQNLTDYMAAFANTSVIPNRVIPALVARTNNATERTVGIPAGCTDDDNCVFQGNNLFPGGVLNQTLAANGAGVIGGADLALGPIGIVNNNNNNNNNNTAAAVTAAVENATAVEAAPLAAPIAALDNDTSAAPVVVDNTTETAPVVVDNSTVVNATNNNNSSRLLQNAAQSVWNPDLDDTGLVYTVVADPAGVLPTLPASTRNDDTSDNSDSGSVLAVSAVTVASLTIAALL